MSEGVVACFGCGTPRARGCDCAAKAQAALPKKTRLYVDRDAIMSKRPPLIVHEEGQPIQHAWEVSIDGPSTLRYQQCGPVPAKVFIETESLVRVVR